MTTDALPVIHDENAAAEQQKKENSIAEKVRTLSDFHEPLRQVRGFGGALLQNCPRGDFGGARRAGLAAG